MSSLALSAVASAPNAQGAREPGELFDLQVLVARKADALSRRRRAKTRAGDRRLWLRAESEVFDHAGNAAR